MRGHGGIKDPELRAEVREYLRKTNMGEKGLIQWSKSREFKRYVASSQGDPRAAVTRNLRLQRRIDDGVISRRDLGDLRKANSFIDRHMAQYRRNGSGADVPGTNLGGRVAALRSWNRDPNYTYTD